MEDGLRLGARHYHATSDPGTFGALQGSFDLILNTVSANLDLSQYLSLLRVDGTLVELGAPEHPMEVPAMPLLGMRRNLSGSLIGGIAETQEMLDFCAEHGVTPEIEVIEPDYINEAYQRVLASDVRYRFVIDTGALAAALTRVGADPGQWPACGCQLGGHPLDVLRPGVAVGDVLDELRDLVARHVAGGPAVRGGEVAHYLFDLVFGQRGGAQQRQQRHPVGTGHTFGVTGAQPLQDRMKQRRSGHEAKSRACQVLVSPTHGTVRRALTARSQQRTVRHPAALSISWNALCIQSA